MMYRPRLSSSHALIIDAIRRAPPGGIGVAGILDEFAGEMMRSTANNAVTAFLKAGLIKRSIEEPYRYRLADGLDDAQLEWLDQAAAALAEMTGETEPKKSRTRRRPPHGS